MEKFLPVRRERASAESYRWPSENVKFMLFALAKGPAASKVQSGEALYYCIVDMQRESGLPHEKHMARHTSDGLSLFFDDLLSRADAQKFFNELLPEIARLALSLPSLLEKQSDDLAKIFALHKSEKELDVEVGLRPHMVLKLLYKQQRGVVVLSQHMVASLLACSFLCLYPSVERRKEDLAYVNLDRLYAGIYERGESIEHKLHCLLHYFRRVCESMPVGIVSFERKVISTQNLKDGNAFWTSSRVPLCPFTVVADGSIEDLGQDCLQVDFANKMLGGGALADGCVQEEIRFMINPELAAGMVFLPAMAANESIEIVGAERFSYYTGYASSFRFNGDFKDSVPRDAWGRRQTRIIAIDALSHPGDDQFRLTYTLRELNKAYCGFLDTASLEGNGGGLRLSSQDTYSESCEGKESDGVLTESVPGTDGSSMELDSSQSAELPRRFQSRRPSDGAVDMIVDDDPCAGEVPKQEIDSRTDVDILSKTPYYRCSVGIATGNWGCGVFGGNLEFKSMLQWLASSQAGRPYLLYFSFQNPDANRLQEVTDWILHEGWSVGELWSMVSEYRQRKHFKINLFDWILPLSDTELEFRLPSHDNGRNRQKFVSYFVQPNRRVASSSFRTGI